MSNEDWDKYRDRIIGLGDNSGRKSYYPELQKKIRELEEKNQNLSTFFDNTNDAIIIHNAAGEIIRVNKKAKEFCNFDKSGTIPILMQDLVVFENKTNSYVEISKKILEGESMLFETRLNNTISNTIFFAEISLKRTIWSGTDSIIAIIRDVSQRKKHENDLFKAKEKAEESSRLKSLFLANMSHEIRTPLNSIAGFSQLITDQSIPIDKREQYSQILIENSYHLIEIVEDIIRMSEIDSGISEKNVSTIELSKLLIELHKSFQVNRKNADIELKLSIILEDSFCIDTDKTKLIQIIINLVNNALKFTPKGSVEFGCRIIDKSILFFVKDTGIGINAAHQKIVFNRFWQADQTYSKKYGGTGLGLSITKAYVELLGGKIWFNSIFAKGTEFYFTLPID